MVQGQAREESKTEFMKVCVWQTKKCELILGGVRNCWNTLGKDLIWLDFFIIKVSLAVV